MILKNGFFFFLNLSVTQIEKGKLRHSILQKRRELIPYNLEALGTVFLIILKLRAARNRRYLSHNFHALVGPRFFSVMS